MNGSPLISAIGVFLLGTFLQDAKPPAPKTPATLEEALAVPPLFAEHFSHLPPFFKGLREAALRPFRFAMVATPAGIGFPMPSSTEAPPQKNIEEEKFRLQEIWKWRDLRDVFRLTYRLYRSKELTKPDPSGELDHYPFFNTLSKIFVVKQRGKTVGTVSLTVDGPHGVTFEEDFEEHVRAIRGQSRRMAGIWRFVVDPTFTESQNLKVSMLLIQAILREVQEECVDTVLFGVHPDHAVRWKTLLKMEEVVRVAGTKVLTDAPQVLLRGSYERARDSRLNRRLERQNDDSAHRRLSASA